MDTVDVASILGKREREDGLGDLVNDVLQQELDSRKVHKVRKSVTIDESQNTQHKLSPPKSPTIEDDEVCRNLHAHLVCTHCPII